MHPEPVHHSAIPQPANLVPQTHDEPRGLLTHSPKPSRYEGTEDGVGIPQGGEPVGESALAPQGVQETPKPLCPSEYFSHQLLYTWRKQPGQEAPASLPQNANKATHKSAIH